MFLTAILIACVRSEEMGVKEVDLGKVEQLSKDYIPDIDVSLDVINKPSDELTDGDNIFLIEYNKICFSERTALEALMKEVSCSIVRIHAVSGIDGDLHISSLMLSGESPICPIREIGKCGISGKIGPYLEKMTMLVSLFMSNLSKEGLDFSCVGRLKYLKIFEPPLDSQDCDLKKMENLKSIVWLELVGCYNVTGSFLKVLPRDSKIQYVNTELSGFNAVGLNLINSMNNIKFIGVTNPPESTGQYRVSKTLLNKLIKQGVSENLLANRKSIQALRSGKEFIQKSNIVDPVN